MRLKLKDPRALKEFSPGIGDTEGFVFDLFRMLDKKVRHSWKRISYTDVRNKGHGQVCRLRYI